MKTHTPKAKCRREVPDTANKICVSNIPGLILQTSKLWNCSNLFGDLKAFVMVRDRDGTGESRVSSAKLSMMNTTNKSAGHCLFRIH